ncbi:hypothetical protein SAMN05660690_1250 [Geodermatophilus telluris]|uniref:4-amino-4-deoxy-L-arabinose transferase n=1 Tax=Geodermatophilus telluris TaxID=1190417 RepID=A0A1G6L9F9_9ACTN|nr:hypothetical protein [Geodermatophilus telluris]SDC39435.1 hypothetical protein SAMN05660690_1250 [Geodermatophilus telluris]
MSELILPSGGPAEVATAPRDVRPATRRPRRGRDSWAALLAVVTSVLALVVLAGFPADDGGLGTTVRGLVLLLFWLTAPGTAITAGLRLPAMTRAAVAPLLGLAVLLALSTLGGWTGVWIPRLGFAVVAAASLVVAALALRRSGLAPLPLPRPRSSTLALGAGLLLSVVLWAIALPRIRTSDPSVLGLLVSGPWQLTAALVVALAVLVAGLRLGRTAVVAGSAVALALVLRVTAAAASAVPNATWTYKHIGIVTVLQDSQHVLGGTNIYMNWPSMFTAAAFFGDASGVATLDTARWFPAMVHVLLAVAAAALARAYGARPVGAAAAAALVVLFNWVGQDYFSPQAVAICLAAGFLVLLVRSPDSRTSAVLALALYVVVVPTHQLTPFWLLGLTVVLAVIRRAPWWLPAAMAVVALGYLASRYDAVASYGIFSGFDIVSNAAGNVAPVPALGRDTAGLFARGTAVLLWLSTLGVLLVRLRRQGWREAWRRRDVVVQAAVTFSPFALLAAQNYGGEAILRVTLYSTVGCVAVLGPALATALAGEGRGVRVLAPLAATAWTVVAGVAVAQATFGPWYVNSIRPEEIRAARFLEAQPDESLVIAVDGNWPGRGWSDPTLSTAGGDPDSGTTGSDADVALDQALREAAFYAGEPVTESLPLSVDALQDVVFSRADGAPVYVVFTESMQVYDDYYRTYPQGSYEDLLATLRSDPDWQVVRQERGTWVLQYVGPGIPPT